MRRQRATTALMLLLLAALVGACGGAGEEATGGGAVQLTLVAYSTPQEAYDEIIDAYRKTPGGRGVRFTKSYGASGDQSRAVQSGLPADIVAFSLEPDMSRLVTAGIVAPEWNAGPTRGMITNSVVVLVVRKGNPKNIRTWEDLTRPGIEVITPNPFTSGGARWNVMAAYGQAARRGGGEANGVEFLNRLFANVAVQDDTARKSLQTFTSGKGDVLIAYENEAIFAQQKDQAIDYVLPDSTIVIENPVAVTKTSAHPREAQAFLDFLRGPPAQELFARNGYRPVTPGVRSPHEFPTPTGLFTIADLGGWADVSKRFFDPQSGIMADVERRIGVSVG
ncbi:MAG TPA: sulfate ABC transporter substrate-binding protein [Acidimicrobiales bacterium]|nr:sulfate ABC transporter substrate-binding protein [Acidimicrobiales bacterium]